jgi:myxalamid-type polyketide synthase MxaB
MESRGVRLGPSCQGLECIWTTGDAVLGKLKPASIAAGFELPMVWIDSAFQLLSALLPQDGPHDFIFTGLESFQMLHPPDLSQPGWCQAVAKPMPAPDSESLTGDLRVFDAAGRLIAIVRNARLERTGAVVTAPAGIASRPQDPVLDELRLAQPGDRSGVMAAYLIRTLAGTLRKQPDEIDVDVPLIGMLDSLMAVELKTRIETDLRIEVPVAAIFEGNSIRELSRHLLAGVAAAEESVDQMIRRLESLPDTTVEAMLRIARGESDG